MTREVSMAAAAYRKAMGLNPKEPAAALIRGNCGLASGGVRGLRKWLYFARAAAGAIARGASLVRSQEGT